MVPQVPAAAPDDWFEDVSELSGVRFSYRNGQEAKRYTILETVGGGVGLLDYDQDGDLDLFLPGGGTIDTKTSIPAGLPSALYRNDGNWKFADVTAEAALDEPHDYSHGCAVADYDRDGYPDIFLTCYGQSRLYRNLGGKRFADVTESADLDCKGWSTAAAWGDIDHDGWPDLYVANYLDWKPTPEKCMSSDGVQDTCPPNSYPSAQDHLFRNLGNGAFREITAEAGILATGKGLGVVAADVNQDDWIDFYVANDVVDNHLYLGAAQPKFLEVAAERGVAGNEFGVPEGSMGVDAGDYDGDGTLDLWVTNFEREDNSLYRNHGGGYFTHATVAAGLGGVSRLNVGFGTGLEDLNLDGWLDLFVINGHVYYKSGIQPYEQMALLFENSGGKRFIDVSAMGGPYFKVPHPGRGAAVGDLDDDGALDLVVVHQNEPVALLRNRLATGNWIRVKLQGAECDLDAFGALVTMTYQGRELVRAVRSGAGYLSHFDTRILFPTEGEQAVSAVVRWPGGHLESFPGLTPRKTHVLIQGQGETEAR